MSLVQKLFSFLVIAIILPLLVVVHLINQDAEDLARDVTSGIRSLEAEFNTDIAMAAEDLIESSSAEMDHITQQNWERLSVEIATQLAAFLYERDTDLLSLAAALSTSQNPVDVIAQYRQHKIKPVTIPAAFRYNDSVDEWQRISPPIAAPTNTKSLNPENQSRFRITPQRTTSNSTLPLYREIAILDLNGLEIHKSSDFNAQPINARNKAETFAKAETYGAMLDNLKDGQIYVSDVIGVYVPTHMVGRYHADQIINPDQKFSPEGSGYAGRENPVGKRFMGIIRYVTPIVQNGKKTGYLSMALDHRHVMEFTDYIITENSPNDTQADFNFRRDIKDASNGNYAFMWDHQGRSIAHPREYFISGFDAETGERVPPWISASRAADFAQSGAEDLNAWLRAQRPYQAQSRNKKPNLRQLKSGNIPLDCRYLDFAPQCEGWQQINSSGGHGSFLIYWSNIWKLATAATIPYYTGQYGESLRGFGVVTIGANIGEFTRSSTVARMDLNNTLGHVHQSFGENISKIGFEIAGALMTFHDQLIMFCAFMIIGTMGVSVLASFRLKARASNLLAKTAELEHGNLSVRIADQSRDEIGRISQAFNNMAETIAQTQNDLFEVNKNLEQIVSQRTDELLQSNQQILDSIDYASRIQRSLLPQKDVLTARLGVTAIVWQPKDVVGGDFYWHRTIGDKDYLVVIDCTGHGVPGAFMTLIATSTLDQIAAAMIANLSQSSKTTTLDDLMQQLHEGICRQLNQVGGGSLSNDGLDAAIIAISHDGQSVEFCGAQMDLFTLSQKGIATRYRGNRTSLGYVNTGVNLPLTVDHLKPEDNMTYIMVTDGITTQIGEEKRRSYGFRRFLETLEATNDNSPKTVNRAIMRDFRAWQGTEDRRDDITLISIQPKSNKPQ